MSLIGAVLLCCRLAPAQESAPARIVSTSSLDGRSIGVRFSKPIEPATATNAANYHLSGGATINGAVLRPDGFSVELKVSGLTGPKYTLGYVGLRDLSGNIASGSAQGVTQGLKTEDIGEPSQTGSAFSWKPGDMEVTAGGADIWGEKDSFHFAHQERTGNFDVRVRVASFAPSGAHLSAKAILMMREKITEGSRYVAVAVYPTMASWSARRRAVENGPSVGLGVNSLVAWPPGTTFPNAWLRLRRLGGTLVVYGSVDGEEWAQIGEAYTPAEPYPETVHIGLATTSHGEQELPYPMVTVGYEQFGDFVVTNGSVAFLRHPTNTVVLENRRSAFTADVQVSGTSSGNLAFQWFKNDAVIAGASKSSYTTPLVTRADDGTRYCAGVALPGGPMMLSKEAVLTVKPDLVPPVVASSFAFTDGLVAARFDEVLRADTASDLAHYSFESGADITEAKLMADGSTVVLKTAGLKVGPNYLTVKGVTDLAGCPTILSRAPVEILDWRSQHIGTVDQAAFAYPGGVAEINVHAGAGNIWTNADSFPFVYQTRTGDFDVSVQLSQIGRVNPYTRGGLMVREDLTPGSRNLYACTYPLTGQKRWVSTVRFWTGGTTTLAPGNSYVLRPPDFAFPNAWFRLKRVGNTFTAYCSTNGVEWVQLGDQLTPEAPYPETVYLGLATTSNSATPGRLATACYLNFADRSEPLASDLLRLKTKAVFPEKQSGGSTRISNPSHATRHLAAGSARLNP